MLFIENEFRVLFFLSLILVLVFVSFVFFVVIAYNKNQIILKTKNQFLESEHEKQLLEKELERNYAIQQERERISHDMHDEIGAGISALKLNIEFVRQRLVDNNEDTEEIDEVLGITSDMNFAMREMLWSLNQKNDNVCSFKDYLFNYALRFFKHSNIKVHLIEENLKEADRLTGIQRRNLLLSAKEALNNIYKHSKAKNVHILLMLKNSILVLDIQDDGIGFGKLSSRGNGLNIMEKRMKELAGDFNYKTGNNGTRMIFKFKIDNH